MTNGDKLSNAEFLKVFVERIQKVVGWPEHSHGFPLRRGSGRDWGVEYAWRLGYQTEYLLDDEAASLVRDHLRGWLLSHCVDLAYASDGTLIWMMADKPGGSVVRTGCTDENSALVAAFDAVQGEL